MSRLHSFVEFLRSPAVFVILAGFMVAAPAAAQQIIVDEGEEPKRHPLILPYAFYTERMEATFGAVAGAVGSPQPQASWFVSPFVTSNKTAGILGGIWDYQVPFIPRLFVRAYGSFGRWEQSRAYTPLGPFDPDPRAGSNDSDQDDFIDQPNLNTWLNVPLRFLLPIGHGSDSDEVISRYVLRDGLLVAGAAGGESWNPLESGQTFLQIEPFLQRESFDVPFNDDRVETLAFRMGIDHDNRDFRGNPSRGHRIQAYVTHDPGWLDRAEEWTFWEVQASKYFSLGESKWFRQTVLALDLWTGDTPSGTAPYFNGARLGGYYRLRGFENNRFSDQAAISYTAELRLMPRWNPIPHIDLMGGIDIDWIQVVLFGEVGRVAPSWSFSELHSDMKWDLGIGLRAMIQKAIFRADVAASEEGARFIAMVSHPF